MYRESESRERLTSFENLHRAWKKASKGHAGNPEVSEFALNLENELFALAAALSDGSYRPGGYRTFTLYERKPRLIAVAPFRDRVVHHALMNVVEPVFEAALIAHSYACRPGKGVHAAVKCYQQWARRYRYAMKIDIRSYFPSIDHAILKIKIRRLLSDPMIVQLFDRIIDSAVSLNRNGVARGLPIGNLTSQHLANVYLSDLDHFVQDELGVPAYLRYVDDMILLANSKRHLHGARYAIGAQLRKDRLALHERKWQVVPVRVGLDVLGYRVWPNRRRIRNDNVYRFSRRLRGMARRYAEGTATWKEINASGQSWLGHARHADSWRLRRDIFRSVVFSKGAEPNVKPRAPRRFLEQQTGQRPVR